MVQLFIAIFGASAIWLSQDSRPCRRRWAPVLGLAGQPFWLYAAWSSAQWGILALSVLYTACWWRGLHGQWIGGGAEA